MQPLDRADACRKWDTSLWELNVTCSPKSSLIEAKEGLITQKDAQHQLTLLSIADVSQRIFTYLSKSFFKVWSLPIVISKKIASQVLFPTHNDPIWEQRRKALTQDLNGEKIQICLNRGEDKNSLILDGMIFTSRSTQGPIAKKALLFAPGADGYYEDDFSQYLIRFIKRELGDINILIMNYPSVMLSKGSLDPDTMALTVYSGLAYLHEELALDLNDIAVFGQSLGGIAAVRGTSIYQKKIISKQPDVQSGVHIISDRSLINIPDVLFGYWGEGCLAALVKSIFEQADWATHDVIESLKKLNGRKLIIHSQYDGVVLDKYSLHMALKKEGLENNCSVLEMDHQGKVDIQQHLRCFNEKEEQRIIVELKTMLGLNTEES